MPSSRCYNKGCGETFNTEENGNKACRYHPGEPFFHDAKKQWTCCNKYSTDFSEFLRIKGCTVGPHNPERPLPAETPKPQIVADFSPPQKLISKVPLKRPSPGDCLQALAPNVSLSLKNSLELLRGKEVTGNADGGDLKKCNNAGCHAVYRGVESDMETCMYHSGVPVFHEGCKYWSCCQKKTTEFEAFLAQEGCTTGRHAWTNEAAINSTHIGIPSTSQCRFDWFQMSRTVTLSVYAKNTLPESADIRCNGVLLSVSFLYDGGKALFKRSFNLYGVIEPSASKLNLTATKVEVVMQKAEACSWPALETTTSTAKEAEAPS